jgi:ribosomal protein S18 acetylase RimI-like enzyme
MQFVDKALARRFEAVEEMVQVFYARVLRKKRPEMNASEEEICGGHMVFAGLGSPIGRATGLGLDRPFTAQDLDQVEEFYRSRKAPSQVDLCPLHDPSVFELFQERGYAIAELNNVLHRKLDPEERFSDSPAGGVIRPGTLRDADEAGALVERAFFPDGAPEPYRGLLAPLYQMEGALVFVANVGETMAACAVGLAVPPHRVVGMLGAGTLNEYRGRGLQTALLCARMAAAAKCGYEYAVVVTQGGTTSQRNCERLGFRVSYSKVTVIKQFEIS